MKKTVSKLADSDDEDVDNLPLKYISSSHKKIISMKELTRYSVHACEFCENKFENRYSYLIHNAKHIIIPLIKMLPLHCSECNWYCIAEEEMNEHMIVNHKTSIKPKSLNNVDWKVDISVRSKFETEAIKKELNDEKPLSCLFKEEENNVVKNILQNFVMNCKVDVEKFVPPWVHQSEEKDHKGNNGIDIHLNGYKKNIVEFGPTTNPNKVGKSDGVSFKTNVVKNESSTKEINRTKSNIDNSKNHAVDSDSSDFSDLDDDPIVILAPVKQENAVEHYSGHDSIHFEDLMKPGIFYCKRCFKRFPNRYAVILHEVVHLNLSKAVLDNNKPKQKKHSTTKISLAPKTTSKHDKDLKTCDQCHEQVSDINSHAKTCYKLYCGHCGKGFKSKTILSAHEPKCNGEVSVNMCDMCLYLKKRPKHLKYCGIVRCSKLEVKRQCHWCEKLCEDVSLVTITNRKRNVNGKRLSERIKFECESAKVKKKFKRQSNATRKVGPTQGSKVLSNRERLKLIQDRLKSMKK